MFGKNGNGKTERCDHEYVQRDIKLRKCVVKHPLAEEEQRRILETCLDDSISLYQDRVISHKLLNVGECAEDLIGEAYILLASVIENYDHAEAAPEKNPLPKGKRAGYLRASFMKFFKSELEKQIRRFLKIQDNRENAYERYKNSPVVLGVCTPYCYAGKDEASIIEV